MVVVRAKPKRKKGKEVLTQAATTNEKLNVLVVAALRSNKKVERRLRNESKEADKAVGRVEQLERALANMRTELNADGIEREVERGRGNTRTAARGSERVRACTHGEGKRVK